MTKTFIYARLNNLQNMLQQLRHQYQLMQQHQQHLRLQQQQVQQQRAGVGVTQVPVTARQPSPAGAPVMSSNPSQFANRYQPSPTSVIKTYPQQQVIHYFNIYSYFFIIEFTDYNVKL